MDVEGFVRNDLASVLALAIDLAAINGSGASNQPRGSNTSGIGNAEGRHQRRSTHLGKT